MSNSAMPPGQPTTVRRFGPGRQLVFIRLYHRWTATNALEKLEAGEQAIRDYFARRRAEHQGGPPAGPGPDVDTFMLHDTVILYSCLAVESFINFYGTARLGESFFKRFVERIGNTEQKIAITIALTTGELVESDAAILKTIRDLFARRGALVHPKAREAKSFTAEALHHALQANVIERADARRSVEDMQQFFELMQQYDPEVTEFLEEQDADDD